MALTKKQREKLRMKFGGRCAYCGCELPEKGWHADHVQAVLRKSEQCMKAAEKRIFRLKSTGDVFRPEADCPENLVPACAPCNLKKGGRTPKQAAMPLHIAPIRPTSWQLQEHGRRFPPNHLHETWRDWLYWDVELEA